jgi:putative transposase
MPDDPGMTNDRHLPVPEGTYFFTVCLEDRAGRTLVDHIDRLRAAYAFATHEMPVKTHAVVILPNHLHAIWTEPGIPRFAERWQRIKARFSLAVGAGFGPSHGRQDQPGGLWQRRFYEHAIRTQDEFVKAMEYCRMNPVKHGIVTDPADWPYSSFIKAAA